MGRSLTRDDTRATPIVLPAIVASRDPGPQFAPRESPVLVAARRAAHAAWVDFLDGHGDVYGLVRARKQLEAVARRMPGRAV